MPSVRHHTLNKITSPFDAGSNPVLLIRAQYPKRINSVVPSHKRVSGWGHSTGASNPYIAYGPKPNPETNDSDRVSDFNQALHQDQVLTAGECSWGVHSHGRTLIRTVVKPSVNQCVAEIVDYPSLIRPLNSE